MGYAKQREQLFLKQKGRCRWCNVRMTPTLNRKTSDPPYPPTMCTLDHLYDKRDPRRAAGKQNTRVAACLECNSKRAKDGSLTWKEHRPVAGVDALRPTPPEAEGDETNVRI